MIKLIVQVVNLEEFMISFVPLGVLLVMKTLKYELYVAKSTKPESYQMPKNFCSFFLL